MVLYDDILDILSKDKNKIWGYEELFIYLAQRIRYFEKKDCWLIRNVETTTKKDYKTNKVEVINTVKDDFIQKIDLKNQLLHVYLPDGLLALYLEE